MCWLLRLSSNSSDQVCVGPCVPSSDAGETIWADQKKREASTTGISAGLAFPGTGTFAAQAYYHINGLGTLRIKKGRSWQSEYPNAYATWAAFGGHRAKRPVAKDGSGYTQEKMYGCGDLFVISSELQTSRRRYRKQSTWTVRQ